MDAKNVGIVGLGKMGKNIALQMLGKGYGVIAYNRSPEPLEEVGANGAKKADSLRELVNGMKQGSRIIWVMLTAGGPTIEIIREIAGYCGNGDIIIDGSNSYYKESVVLHEELKRNGIAYLDAGCSGGPSGALNGMCIMVGGDKKSFDSVESLFSDLSVKNGYMYTGRPGSGHFTKMVHNAIEYGMMQSIGEGFDLLENGPFSGDLDISGLAGLWKNGSVIRGYLMELAEKALEGDQHLDDVAPYVEDTGEGRWSVKEAIEYSIPFNAISSSLYERFNSRSQKRFADRIIAALRHEFGGHQIKKK
ncbi:MAG: decarboxylating 6-phosphogluconate dehydrogenase [Candidatus Marsarchaeota archaeon]|nr:decarboxylating 6-phosphogluconate dehydrogenase [Candidatus Marsarchaeota archaeon]MCL5413320.1 decarboxylating 6-phosphogluconate dehydrogenase [Candidatus Marsarchaeota archaeon]